MTTTVYFIRHCTVDYTGNPNSDLTVSLSQEGWLQAKKLEENWDIPVSKIYSSPLPRAIQTTTPLSHKLGRRIFQVKDLRELDYKGNAQEFHRRIVSNINFKFKGGESISQANERFKQIVTKLCEINKGQSIIISTHGTVLSEFLIQQFKFPPDFFFRLSYPDVYKVLYIDSKFRFSKRCLEYLPYV